MREVEEYSHHIGEAEKNEDYFISNTWLSQIENSESTPSIYKLYSLSVIYGVKFTDLLAYYGVELDNISKHQAELPARHTRLTDLAIYDGERLMAFPVRFDPGFKLTVTTFIRPAIEKWGEVPIGLLQHLNIRDLSYGFVGLTDRTLYPIVLPGSFVQIDTNYTTVDEGPWQTELDRPIYFIELRDGYACSWCEFSGKQLLLIPHPQSGYKIRSYLHPKEAEVVGRVTALAMRIVQPPPPSPDDSLRLPTPP
jgi:transcriptional regulator with XRE-family HTH domain